METQISGCVVLYNPPDDLVENIKSYIDRIDKLFVIDNTETDNETIVRALRTFGSKLHYHPNRENLGIATALNQGCVLAIKHGARWLLTMDQDSLFSSHNYFEAFDNYSNKSAVALFSPVHDQLLALDESNYIASKPRLYVMTSGNILNLDLYQEIGGFKENFFIDEVDHEYCLRAWLKKYPVIEFYNCRLNHRLGALTPVLRGSETKKMIIHSPLRNYYIFRNGTYMVFRYLFHFPRFSWQRASSLFVILAKTILFFPDKLERLFQISRALLHVVIGRFGKRNYNPFARKKS